MNYVSVVYAILVSIIAVDWSVRGQHGYRGQDRRHDEAAAALRGSGSGEGENEWVRDSMMMVGS